MSTDDNTQKGLSRPAGSTPEAWRKFLTDNKNVDPNSDQWTTLVSEFKSNSENRVK